MIDSDKIQRGGDAFPMQSSEGYYPGMSLLDWFAGQVAPGCMMAVVGKVRGHVVEEVHVAAKAAYRMAAVLVAESEERQMPAVEDVEK